MISLIWGTQSSQIQKQKVERWLTGLEGRGMGSYHQTVLALQMKKVLWATGGDECIKNVHLLNATELYTLKWLKWQILGSTPILSWFLNFK